MNKTEKMHIGRKKYDYFASAYISRETNLFIAKANQNPDQITTDQWIAHHTKFLRLGLISGRQFHPWWKRLWLSIIHPIPSEERLIHLVDFNRVMFPLGNTQNQENQEEEEKDPK